jgi:hypothetical protein
LRELRQADENIWLKALMHIGYYLMIAAFVIMGVELAFAIHCLMGLYLMASG